VASPAAGKTATPSNSFVFGAAQGPAADAKFELDWATKVPTIKSAHEATVIHRMRLGRCVMSPPWRHPIHRMILVVLACHSWQSAHADPMIVAVE